MTLKDLPIGKTATIRSVGGEGGSQTAFPGHGTDPEGRCNYGKVCSYGRSHGASNPQL